MFIVGQIKLHPSVVLEVKVDHYGSRIITNEQWQEYVKGLNKVAIIANIAESLSGEEALDTPSGYKARTKLVDTIRKSGRRNASRTVR